MWVCCIDTTYTFNILCTLPVSRTRPPLKMSLEGVGPNNSPEFLGVILIIEKCVFKLLVIVYSSW